MGKWEYLLRLTTFKAKVAEARSTRSPSPNNDSDKENGKNFGDKACHQNCRGRKRKNNEVDSSSSESDSEDDSDNDSTFGSDYDPNESLGDPGGDQAEPPEPDTAPNEGGDPGGAQAEQPTSEPSTKAQYKINSLGKQALYFEHFLFVKAKPKIGKNKEVIGQIWRCEKMHSKNCRARVHVLSDDTIVTKAEQVHHTHLGDPLKPIINKVGLFFLKGVSC